MITINPAGKTQKAILIEAFTKAIEVEAGYVSVQIMAPGLVIPETIINPIDNAAEKLKYYTEKYDDDLKMIANPAICIVGIAACEEGSEGEFIGRQYAPIRRMYKLSNFLDRLIEMTGGKRNDK